MNSCRQNLKAVDTVTRPSGEVEVESTKRESIQNSRSSLDTNMAAAASHLVVLFCATAGQNGENLGSDEEQIVLFVYLLYDLANNKVSGREDLRVSCVVIKICSALSRCDLHALKFLS